MRMDLNTNHQNKNDEREETVFFIFYIATNTPIPSNYFVLCL